MITFITLSRLHATMAHPLVSVRFPPQLLADTERIVQSQGYASTQEFIREAVRRQVQEQNIVNLKRLIGVAKGHTTKSMTAKERDTMALDLMREAREHGEVRVDFRSPGTQADFEAFLAGRKKKR